MTGKEPTKIFKLQKYHIWSVVMDSEHIKPKIKRELFNMKLVIHVKNSKNPNDRSFSTYSFCSSILSFNRIAF